MKSAPAVPSNFLIVILLVLVCATPALADLESGVPMDTWLDAKTIGNIAIVVPDNSTRLSVTITGGSGDLNLYLKYGSAVTGSTMSAIEADADIRSDGPASEETIVLTSSGSPALSAGSWYIATVNLNDDTTYFTLSATVEQEQEDLLALPIEQTIYPPYPSQTSAVTGASPDTIKPIGVGDIAGGGDNVAIKVQLEKPSGPYDAYFALHVPKVVASEYFLLGQDGNLHPATQEGLVKWKQSSTLAINEKPFGEFPAHLLPGGDYFLYFFLTPANSLEAFYFWGSSFNVADVVVDSVPDGSAGFFDDTLVVPGGTILYKGELHEESAPLAEDGIAAITKDGKTYLYHPAMGQTELSEYNSRRAVGYFMAGLSASEVATLRAQRSRSYKSAVPAVSTRSASNTAAKLIGVGQTMKLGTGVDITLLDSKGKVKAVNRGRRFAAVKTGNSKSNKYFLIPKSNLIPTETLDHFLSLGEVVIGDLDGVISRVDTERSDIVATSKIETFGAFMYMGPVFESKSGWDKNQLEAIEKDKELMALVNAVDLKYRTLEYFKTMIGLLPLECADIFTTGYFRHLQYQAVEALDNNAAAKFDKAFMYSVGSSFIGCSLNAVGTTVGGLGGPAGAGFGFLVTEAYNTFFDIVSAFNWVVEDVLFDLFLAYNGTHFDAYDLAVMGTGMVAYSEYDEGNITYVLNMADGKSWHVAGGFGESCNPKAMSKNGVLVIYCNDKTEEDDDRLISVMDWGRGAQTRLPEACGVHGWDFLGNVRVDVDDAGRVYFRAEKSWTNDSTNKRIIQDGIYRVNADGSKCEFLPIDIPPDNSNKYDRLYPDSLRVTGDSERVVFSDNNDGEEVLVSVHPRGAHVKTLVKSEDRIYVVDVSDSYSGYAVFKYQPDPESSGKELGVVSIGGGSVINVKDVTGLNTNDSLIYNGCISSDGSWIAARRNQATSAHNLFIMKSDGSDWRVLDTGSIFITTECQFHPDGKSIIFTGLDTKLPQDSWKTDLYAVNLDQENPNIRNLTNTPDVSESNPTM